MKNIFALALTLLFFVSTTVNAQNDSDKMGKAASFMIDDSGNVIETTKPMFEFTNESHDFGTVEEGPKIKHQFPFKNVGKEPLIISNVKASCGCTTPDWSKEPIMPGEESVITAIYNTSKRIGPFNKSVTITSNAYTPTKRLFIKGKVVKPNAGNGTSPVRKPSIVEQNN
ncbi:MAG: DUF1573 domain-containing protein [Chitinophagales bacterium]